MKHIMDDWLIDYDNGTLTNKETGYTIGVEVFGFGCEHRFQKELNPFADVPDEHLTSEQIAVKQAFEEGA